MEILASIESMPTWSQPDVQGLLRQMTTVAHGEIEWDPDAGEEWARLIVDNEVDCLIRAPTSAGEAHRFAFLRSPATSAEALRRLLDANDVDVVELIDFEEPCMWAKAERLAAFIGPKLPPAHAFDPQRFSANDLWFVSV